MRACIVSDLVFQVCSLVSVIDVQGNLIVQHTKAYVDVFELFMQSSFGCLHVSKEPCLNGELQTHPKTLLSCQLVTQMMIEQLVDTD